MKKVNPLKGVNGIGYELINVAFTTNGSSDPAATSVQGDGIASVTYSATGKYIVTMSAGVFAKEASQAPFLDADSAGDGAYASVYCPDYAASPLVFHVFTHAADGTKTNYTGRKAGFHGLFKTSGVGT